MDFFCKTNAYFYTLNESRPLMIPTQLTDRVYDPIHLPEGHSVHLSVEIIEVCTDLFVVIRVVFIADADYSNGEYLTDMLPDALIAAAMRK